MEIKEEYERHELTEWIIEITFKMKKYNYNAVEKFEIFKWFKEAIIDEGKNNFNKYFNVITLKKGEVFYRGRIDGNKRLRVSDCFQKPFELSGSFGRFNNASLNRFYLSNTSVAPYFELEYYNEKKRKILYIQKFKLKKDINKIIEVKKEFNLPETGSVRKYSKFEASLYVINHLLNCKKQENYYWDVYQITNIVSDIIYSTKKYRGIFYYPSKFDEDNITGVPFNDNIYKNLLLFSIDWSKERLENSFKCLLRGNVDNGEKYIPNFVEEQDYFANEYFEDMYPIEKITKKRASDKLNFIDEESSFKGSHLEFYRKYFK